MTQSAENLRMGPTEEDIENWFEYHEPKPDQVLKYKEIREEAKQLARLILRHCPKGADQTDTIRQLRKTVMMANASISCHKGES